MDWQLRAWLALAQSPGWTPRRIGRAWTERGSIEALFAAPVPGAPALPDPRWPGFWETSARWLEAGGDRNLLSLDDPRYPHCLRQIEDPPPLLYVQGDAEVVAWPQLAMVGSRRASSGGGRLAEDLARETVQAGLVATSGLALGIDARVHQGALQAQGLTLAVLGSGIDVLYPARNRNLATAILEGGGALVSAFPPGTPPRAAHFPQRNRIISGLSLGVLVVEATERSGSLITARLAAEQGREVFALPGPARDPAYAGCHQLIRTGATLVVSMAQILQELGPQFQAPDLSPSPRTESHGGPEAASAPAPVLESQFQSPAARALLEALEGSPLSLDQLVARTGLTADETQTQLLELELAGQAAAVPGGYQRS